METLLVVMVTGVSVITQQQASVLEERETCYAVVGLCCVAEYQQCVTLFPTWVLINPRHACIVRVTVVLCVCVCVCVCPTGLICGLALVDV